MIVEAFGFRLVLERQRRKARPCRPRNRHAGWLKPVELPTGPRPRGLPPIETRGGYAPRDGGLPPPRPRDAERAARPVRALRFVEPREDE